MVSLPPKRTTELFYDGAWNTVTPDMRDTSAITITRGRSAEGKRVDPGAAAAVIDNRSSRYSPRNPTSPLFGKIGRNTPIRFSVDAGSPWLGTDGAGRATTPDTAALDITGDIDVRVEVSLEDWDPTEAVELAGKYDAAANERSWLLFVGGSNRELVLRWSEDGIATAQFGSSETIPVPASGRIALRSTLDVDGGDSAVTHYTAPSIDGPWTQLGITGSSGLTSIHAGTAPLDVGDVAGAGAGVFFPPVGKFYAFELRSGIDGTLVADVDFTAQGVGAGSFTDDAGLVWTVEGDADLTNTHVRMAGEVPAWPPGRDLSGNDRHSVIAPAGITRRLGAGNKPLRSVFYRALTADDLSPIAVAYWPGEDQSEATLITSAVPGGAPMTISGTPTLSSFTGFVASAPIPVMKDGSFSGAVPAYTVTGESQIRFLMAVPSGGIANDAVICRFTSTGTAKFWELIYSTGTGGSLRLVAYDSDGVVIDTNGPSTFEVDGKLLRVSIELTQNGPDVDTVIATLEPGASLASVISNAFPAATVGNITSISIGPGGDLGDTAIGHVSLQAGVTTLFDLSRQLVGYAGERAGTRVARVAAEQSVAASVRGDTNEQARLGPQRRQKFLDVLNEAAKADLGFMIEQRGALALAYRGHSTLYNQPPTITLDFSAGVISAPFKPLDDDKLTENEVAVTREGASTSPPVILETGRMSVQDPPDGVGRYDVDHPLSLQDDALAVQTAGWLLHLGTFDGLRYTKLTLDLANPRVHAMIDSILRADVGDKIRITNLPDDYGPDDVDLIIQGYSETMGPETWKITFNCTPGGPWTVATVAADDPADDGPAVRVDHEGSELAAAVAAAATEWLVHTPGTFWVTSDGLSPIDVGDLPFDVRAGGEVVTASAIEPLAWDAFGRIETDTWGIADSGHTWSEAGGDATDRSVDGSAGVITLQANPGTIRFQQIIEDVADFEILVSITPDQVAAGAAFLPAVLLRASGDYYRCRLVLGTDQSVSLQVVRVVTQVGDTAATPYTYGAGTTLWLRVRIDGQRVRGKVWPDGNREPGPWQIDETVVTDPIDSGALGITCSAFGTNTNVNPAFAYDDFEVITPQRWTVTRSVNGVVKAQAAGETVGLATPPIVAL